MFCLECYLPVDRTVSESARELYGVCGLLSARELAMSVFGDPPSQDAQRATLLHGLRALHHLARHFGIIGFWEPIDCSAITLKADASSEAFRLAAHLRKIHHYDPQRRSTIIRSLAAVLKEALDGVAP